MGRQLRRVPLDFDWPVNKTWKGFLMDPILHGRNCEACDSTGYSPFAHHLHKMWYGYTHFEPKDRGSVPLTPETPAIRRWSERQCERSSHYYGTGEEAILRESLRVCAMWNRQWCHHLNQDDVDALVEGKRLTHLTHVWDATERKWEPTGYHPTAQEINEWSIEGFGHDSINQWIVLKAECERKGVSSTCPVCHGEGEVFDSVEHRGAHDSWKQTEPPEGPGYQMWETTSEGSPITPVFATPEELASYLVPHYPRDGTYEQWMKMIVGDGWAPSGMTVNGEFVSGVEGMACD